MAKSEETQTVTGTTDAAAEAPVAAAPVPLLQDAPETTEQRVRRWIAENLVHGRIARDPELWNEIQAAVPALVAIIDA